MPKSPDVKYNNRMSLQCFAKLQTKDRLLVIKIMESLISVHEIWTLDINLEINQKVIKMINPIDFFVQKILYLKASPKFNY